MLFYQRQPSLGGGNNLCEVRLELGLSRFIALFSEHFAVADDVIDGGAKFMTEDMKVGCGGTKAIFAEMLVNLREQDVSAATNLLEIGNEVIGQLSGSVLLKKLGVPNDMIDGRS
jgi:hypothetical protein